MSRRCCAGSHSRLPTSQGQLLNRKTALSQHLLLLILMRISLTQNKLASTRNNRLNLRRRVLRLLMPSHMQQAGRRRRHHHLRRRKGQQGPGHRHLRHSGSVRVQMRWLKKGMRRRQGTGPRLRCRRQLLSPM
jgi:hypothetical protein